MLLQREVSQFASAREFLFKHALLRDVAYDGVLRAHRQRYHRSAAAWLAETSAAVGRADEYAAVIAEHYEKGRDPAAGWYLRAGTRAASVYELDEATRLLETALEQADPDDLHQRFDILKALESIHDRSGKRDEQQHGIEAMTALEPHLDPARQVELLLIRGRHSFVHSEYDDARRLTGDAVELATELQRNDLLAEATLWRGKALTWAELPDEAHASLTRSVELARAAGRPEVVGEGLRYLGMVAGNIGDFATSVDLTTQARVVFARAGDIEMESAALVRLATTYFNLHRYDEALEALEATLPIFRRFDHRYGEAVNTGNLASIALVRGRLTEAARWADSAFELTTELEELEAGRRTSRSAAR